MIYEPSAPAHGNVHVVKLLERYLEKARLGRINYAFVGVTELPDKGDYNCAGSTEMEDVALAALDLIRKQVETARATRLLPDQDPTCPADLVCYNVADGSVGYDFLVWLIDATMTMRREGLSGPLKVAFFMGRDGDESKALNTPARRQMFDGVMRPALKLIGAVEVSYSGRYRSKPTNHWQDIIPAVRNGETVSCWQASRQAMEQVGQYVTGQAPITITLREAVHSSHRNSNLPEWLKFARDLRASGERVIFVRDTAKAFDPFEEFQTCPLASINLDVRCALYSRAKANLFVSNGPIGIAQFSPIPWLMFCELNENDEFLPNRPQWWRESSGLEPGAQLPWCTPQQRIVWERDTYENIARAWQQMWNAQARAAA